MRFCWRWSTLGINHLTDLHANIDHLLIQINVARLSNRCAIATMPHRDCGVIINGLQFFLQLFLVINTRLAHVFISPLMWCTISAEFVILLASSLTCVIRSRNCGLMLCSAIRSRFSDFNLAGKSHEEDVDDPHLGDTSPATLAKWPGPASFSMWGPLPWASKENPKFGRCLVIARDCRFFGRN